MRKTGMSEAEFERKNQCKVNSILAIEKSDEFDDWRELIRLYMVRPHVQLHRSALHTS